MLLRLFLLLFALLLLIFGVLGIYFNGHINLVVVSFDNCVVRNFIARVAIILLHIFDIGLVFIPLEINVVVIFIESLLFIIRFLFQCPIILLLSLTHRLIFVTLQIHVKENLTQLNTITVLLLVFLILL